MVKRGRPGPEPSRGQALRAGAQAALAELASAARSEEDHADLARRVLRLALVRCAEVHHPAGVARLQRAHRGVEETRLPGLESAPLRGVESASLHGFDSPSLRGAEEAAARRLREAPVPDPYQLGAVHEALLATRLTTTDGKIRVTTGDARRNAGAHYTGPVLARRVVTQTLGPLLTEGAPAESALALRVCDAAMGGGAFLLAACEVLAEHVAGASRDARDLVNARREVARSCLFGVDKDPAAAGLARVALWIATASEEEPDTFLGAALRVGDALVGPPHQWPPWPRGVEPFDWSAAFPEALGARGGFDAIVGNPPWISYAGRAAQPLDPELREHYERTSPAFFGYRNLQALFVHRAATLLRPGGRLGLVVPTSMCDLAGYEPSRRAHDAWCEVDAALPDFGDRFDDVFQPCMGLFSTRRAKHVDVARAGPWPLERSDLDERSAALLARLDALPKVPAATFGERGFQSTGDDVRKMRPNGGESHAGDAGLRSGSDEIPPTGTDETPRTGGEVGLRIGSDVGPFRRSAPSFVCDPRDFEGRFRADEQWRAVSVLVRQTARYPMACLGDGVAFRNSVLAGFASEELPAELLVAYLNAWPVRWFHYVRHRDARQGMPQMKIAHLRALPSPAADPSKRAALEELAALGSTLSVRNDGARPEEQRALDELAADLLGLDEDERAIVRAWAATFTTTG